MQPYLKQTVPFHEGEIVPPEGYYLAFAEFGEDGYGQPAWYLIWAPMTEDK